MGFLSRNEIEKIGFKKLGQNVNISDKASIYGAQNISIGDHSRIDDFCFISSGLEGIEIGSYVHISVFCSITGKSKIVLSDFSGLSSKVAIFSSSDDYSGSYLTNPCVPSKFTNVDSRPIHIGKHVIIGVGSTILPGVEIGDGTAVGAYTLVNKNLEKNIIAVGIPAKKIKNRKLLIYELEEQLKKINQKNL